MAMLVIVSRAPSSIRSSLIRVRTLGAMIDPINPPMTLHATTAPRAMAEEPSAPISVARRSSWSLLPVAVPIPERSRSSVPPLYANATRNVKKPMMPLRTPMLVAALVIPAERSSSFSSSCSAVGAIVVLGRRREARPAKPNVIAASTTDHPGPPMSWARAAGAAPEKPAIPDKNASRAFFSTSCSCVSTVVGTTAALAMA